ncbi:hypothetical protein F511_19458 [Dorcoceras hygrometricum]|uniref:Uncharacterized protein n=1 Tax=Dorcoceras hygrometricum TaxID=472368 RepID=A0A2Z7A5S1_9LAMI|nr:hypothetical protein F511_19458 [Dorcoceras hygrometricum]
MMQYRRLAPTIFIGKPALQRLAAIDLLIRSTTGNMTPSSASLEDLTNLPRTDSPRRRDRNKSNHVNNGGGGRRVEEREEEVERGGGGLVSRQLVQYKDSAVGLVFIESAVELAMETYRVKSVVRNQAEAKLNQLKHNKPDPIDNIVYPRTRASGESSTTKHRLLHASGPHPIPPPNDPIVGFKRVKVRHLSCRVSMTFRVVRTNQYNQDLELIHAHGRAVNPRQRSIDSYMHRDLTQSRHLMTPLLVCRSGSAPRQAAEEQKFDRDAINTNNQNRHMYRHT